MGRSQSSRDEALSIALRAHGVYRTVRQLERARQAGLLESRRRTGLGHARGSQATPQADELDRALLAARLLDEHRNYSRAVLAMFVQARFPVRPDKLQKAYAASLASDLAGLEKLASRSGIGLPEAAAQSIAHRAAKDSDFSALRKRLRDENRQWRREGGRFITVAEQLESLFEDVLRILTTGQASSRAALDELLKSFGLTVPQLTSGQITEETSLESVEGGMTQGQASTIPSRLASASVTELHQARDEAVLLRTFARAYVYAASVEKREAAFGWSLAASIGDIALAYSVPGFLALREQYPSKMDELVEGCRTALS